MTSALRERIARLEAAGASAFDGPTLRYVETLLARAEADLPEGAAERLIARAKARLDRLEDALNEARKEAASHVAALEAVDPESAREAHEIMVRGDHREASRLARSRLVRHDPEAPTRLLDRLSSLEDRARAFELRFPADLRNRLDALRAAPLPLGAVGLRAGFSLANKLSMALLDAVLSRSRSSLLVLRMARGRHLPEQVGPYNPRAVATRALDRVGKLAPDYLRVWLDVLGDLAALERLVPPKASPPRRRR